MNLYSKKGKRTVTVVICLILVFAMVLSLVASLM